MEWEGWTPPTLTNTNRVDRLTSSIHPSIHPSKTRQEHLILVSELLKDNLYEYGKFLRETNQPSYFTEPRLRLIARQCLEALAFIHSLGLLHCDIKVRCGCAVPVVGSLPW